MTFSIKDEKVWMDDHDEQENELLALGSIYDKSSFRPSEEDDITGGEFSAELPERSVQISCKSNSSKPGIAFGVDYLPPITINFTLPKEYPSRLPPNYTLSCKWLNRIQLTKLCHELDRIWDENVGCVVLFQWMQFLKDEALDSLGIGDTLDVAKYCYPVGTKLDPSCESPNACSPIPVINFDKMVTDSRTIQELCSLTQILQTFTDYNQSRKKEVFETSYVNCKICLTAILGSQCMQYKECEHTFCKNCVRNYFETQIKEGNVKCLNCPEEKCSSEPTPSQVKELVGSDLFSRYDELLLNTLLDTMPDVVRCPRQFCQCPCIQDGQMATCSACNYVFCVRCKMVYHGTAMCRLRNEEKRQLCNKYLNASYDEKKELEKRYGEKQLRRFVEDFSSETWIEKYSKNCPKCSASIEKSDGCNKMTCSKCNSYFCWLCLTVLKKGNPYLHYNNPESPCANRLFEGVDEDGDDDDFYDGFDTDSDDYD